MKETIIKNNLCPHCGQAYSGRPAISRADNKTQICADCGTREALESIGVITAEQDRILEIIHQSQSQ